MHAKSLVLLAAFTIQGGVVSIPRASRVIVKPEGAMDVRELLASARGVAPAVCSLASDGASNWGGGWDAPDVDVRSDSRRTLRNLRNGEITDAEGRALLDALTSDDACVRYLAGTLIGRSGDKSFVPELSGKLESQSAVERAGAARVLGLLGDRLAVDPLMHALRDATPAVRANAAWALGRIGERRATQEIAGLLRDA